MIQNLQTILIVDDNPDVTTSLRICLNAAGYRVLEAENGEIGLMRAEQEKPAMILCDERMPKMDGWETLARLKKNPNTAHIPVVMIGGTGLPDEGQWKKLGACGVIAKPFHFSELLDAVRSVLSPQSVGAP